MHKVWLCVFVLVLVRFCLALALYRNNKKVKHCDYDNMEILSGKPVSIPGKCLLAVCLGESVATLTCTDFKVAAGCHKTEVDYSKPFPECCPQKFCE